MTEHKNSEDYANLQQVQVRVRYADTDRMGIVYHANYLLFFESCRTELIRRVWKPYLQIEQEGYLLVVLEAHCRYRQSARYDDLLTVQGRVGFFTETRIRFEYQIFREGLKAPIVEGYTEHCWTDASGKPRRMPSELKDILKQAEITRHTDDRTANRRKRISADQA
ncbi:MAG: thioesterase family protein [bacterium]|nr:thioesterase family protein [bacterium]